MSKAVREVFRAIQTPSDGRKLVVSLIPVQSVASWYRTKHA